MIKIYAKQTNYTAISTTVAVTGSNYLNITGMYCLARSSQQIQIICSSAFHTWI